jgi:hypothetical protein
MDVEEADISSVHLVLPHRRWERDRRYVDRLVGRDVHAEGTLFHGHTGHHHEALVLVAARVKPRQRRH